MNVSVLVTVRTDCRHFSSRDHSSESQPRLPESRNGFAVACSSELDEASDEHGESILGWQHKVSWVGIVSGLKPGSKHL